jgi:hypothetical protein
LLILKERPLLGLSFCLNEEEAAMLGFVLVFFGVPLVSLFLAWAKMLMPVLIIIFAVSLLLLGKTGDPAGFLLVLIMSMAGLFYEIYKAVERRAKQKRL